MHHNPYCQVVALLLLVTAIGCGQSEPPTAVYVQEGDTEMLTAREKAKATFEFFKNNWQTMKNDGYSVKFGLPTRSGSLEHIWFSPTKIEGDKITAECANIPIDIAGLELGETRTFTVDEVSDWMIIVGEKCYGGYTLRVHAERGPPATPSREFVDPPES